MDVHQKTLWPMKCSVFLEKRARPITFSF